MPGTEVRGRPLAQMSSRDGRRRHHWTAPRRGTTSGGQGEARETWTRRALARFRTPGTHRIGAPSGRVSPVDTKVGYSPSTSPDS